MAAASSTVIRRALVVARDSMGAGRDQSWAVSGQGAVGHVIGLRAGADACVMKLFTAPGSLLLAERERHALQFVVDYAGVPVPRLTRFGQIAAEPPVRYLIMTRLPGVRWADRRVHLSRSESTARHRGIGRLLRRFHAESPRIDSTMFGGVLETDPGWPALGAAVDDQCRQLASRYRQAGGSADLARAVEAFVVHQRDVLLSCPEPVLCHNDFIGGNLLITEAGWPEITGVTDFDRASFFDPAADLAQALRHATQQEPADARELLAAYGIDDDGRRRLAVHRVLLTLLNGSGSTVTGRPVGANRSIGSTAFSNETSPNPDRPGRADRAGNFAHLLSSP